MNMIQTEVVVVQVSKFSIQHKTWSFGIIILDGVRNE